ncbi:MAG: hypothetical protein LQ340_007050 [Diploschistes diacapsis]|nr:MAG: hypothetical protein LQ340_007050 [Diploschistes diacapsis]
MRYDKHIQMMQSCPLRSKESEQSPDQAQDSNESIKPQHPFAASINKPLPNTLLTENARPKFLGDLSRNGSEADSLIELYRQQKGEASLASAEDIWDMEHAMHVDDPNSKWVHRDKLTMIEIQEYRERGMEVPAELLSRAGIRPESRKSKKGRHESQERGPKEGKRQRVRSPSPVRNEDDGEGLFVPDDPRSPEEIAANPNEEAYLDSIYNQGKLRSSSSRIPIATTSPHPIPAEHIERHKPLPRKRAQSNGDMDEDSIIYSKVRSRGNSMSNQVLLDDEEAIGSAPGSPESPSKLRAAKGQTSPRKPSATIKVVPGTTYGSASAKARTVSATMRNSPGARPGTRSGLDGRPRTAANRPEGDPPWIDTMYKPDPRLPPEKQILPTHAKRIMQEQWEKEGKVGSAYDRNFTPVAILDDSHVQARLPTPPAEELKQPQIPARDDSLRTEWPMKASNSTETPKNSSSEHAGYSTMPKLQSTPSLTAVPSPRIQRPEQSLQLEEPEKKSKGCGCCIVM